MGDTGKIIDLSGCSLENVLYEISAQRAVIAKTGENSSTVIVGYDEYNTWLLDPATGEVKPYGMQDSTKAVSEGRKYFYYLSGSCDLLTGHGIPENKLKKKRILQKQEAALCRKN